MHNHWAVLRSHAEGPEKTCEVERAGNQNHHKTAVGFFDVSTPVRRGSSRYKIREYFGKNRKKAGEKQQFEL